MLALLATAVVLLGPALQQGTPPSPFKPPTHEVGFGNDFSMKFSIEWVYEGFSLITQSCTNACKGKVHEKHADCSSQCDDWCVAKHEWHYDPAYWRASDNPDYKRTKEDRHKEFIEVLSKVGSDWKRQIDLYGSAFPGMYDADFESWIVHDVKPVLQDKSKGIHISLASWNTEPCSREDKSARCDKWRAVVNWQAIRYDQGPDGRRIPVEGPKGRWEYGTLVTYSFDPDQKSVPVVNCLCRPGLAPTQTGEDQRHEEFKKQQNEERKKQIEEHVPPPEPPTLPKDGDGLPLTPDDLNKLKFEPIANDMNEIVVRAENPYPYPITLQFSAGTIWDCDDDNYQDVIMVDPLVLSLGPLASEQVSLHGPAAAGAEVKEAKGKIACIEMHKREPNKNVKFHASLRSDPDLARLCALSKNEIIGFNVQPRIWIYTDHATFDEIAGVLFPKPTPGQYMDVCYDVAQVAHVNMLSSAYKRCLTPELLFGKGRVRPAAAAWYCATCESADAEGLALTVASHDDGFAPLLGPDADDRTVQRVASTLAQLTCSENGDVAIAGANALLKVPEARRSAMVLSGVYAMLLSKDAKACAAAMDVVEQYHAVSAWAFLSGLEAPTPELKARAAELCKKLLAAKAC